VARFVVAQTGNDSQYEDLCQTIFVKMVLSLARLRDVARFEPWLFQIARNVCRDHQRARSGWRRVFVSYEPAHDQVGVSETSPAPRFGPGVVELGISRLPDTQRRLLELSLQEARSYEDLAGLSNSTVSAIKSRLFRARENLKRILLAGEPE
jgi:RNA polymerase sigma-70 factor (ECF subfamily)